MSCSSRIKQHLRIKPFFSTAENALKLQIWIADPVYVPDAIIKKKLQIDDLLYTLLQILSVTLFVKMPLQQVCPASEYIPQKVMPHNQLSLFTI